jgi:malonyl-CoA/methylmalonyl-CoA synthetase
LKQVALLAADSYSALGSSITSFVQKTQSHFTKPIPILSNLARKPLSSASILISASHYLSDNSAGVVIFTSGTTGPPKGTFMRRAYVHDCALVVSDHYDVTASDVILHVLPVHHATGIGITFFPFLISGSLIEFCSGSFDPAWMWERWWQGGLMFFSGVPTIYMRMINAYRQLSGTM